MSPIPNGFETRQFLLLQGPIGPLFAQLGDALSAAGHGVLRIRFNGGDWLFSGASVCLDFRGPQDRWPEFLERTLRDFAITDIVLFGDCRPLHRLAVIAARARGLRVHVFEEGYLRPGWVTLERDGVNGHSRLPAIPGAYLGAAAPPETRVPMQPMAAPMPFLRRAIEDVAYTLATALCWPLYPGYRTHKPWSPLAEYRAGARRFFTRARERAAAQALAAALVAEQRPFFLFPLQLDSDAQIRVHSEFGAMAPAIEAVIASFARAAPAEVQLVISEHPLDQAVVDLQAVVQRAAAAAGLSSRVVFLRGGTPPPLLGACRGLVTVNSTIALSALELGRPVVALGRAVYRIPGLVHAAALDAFWTAPTRPDDALFAAFRRVLIERTQIPGGFYSPHARLRVVTAALPRLAGPAPLPAAEPDFAPDRSPDRYAAATE